MVAPFPHGGEGVRVLIQWSNSMHGVGGSGAPVRRTMRWRNWKRERMLKMGSNYQRERRRKRKKKNVMEKSIKKFKYRKMCLALLNYGAAFLIFE